MIDEDNWIQRLWDWADENEISDLRWSITDYEQEYYGGIPRTKEKLLQLTELELAEEYFSELPKEIGNLTNLESISIHSCPNLTTLPKEIGNLYNLKELNLSDTIISKIPKEITQLKNLTSLDFGGSFTQLPKEIGNLSNLESLSISSNKLSTLPKEIGNFTNLESLTIYSCNKLTTLPKEIGNFTNLEYFYIFSCYNLITLPKEIGNFSNLESLTVSSCDNLTTLPKEIGNFTNLESLTIYSCRNFTNLPIEIYNLNNLKELKLSKTKMNILPIEIFKLNNLKELNLSLNKFTQLPKEIGNLNNLESLSLHSCKNLTTLPNSICYLINLQEIILPNRATLRLTQKQKIWLFDLVESGCDVIDGGSDKFGYYQRIYDPRYEGLKGTYPWWDVFDIWELEDKSLHLSKNEKLADLKDQTLTWIDKSTGLMWEVKNIENIEDEYLWKDSFRYAERLNSINYAGYNDWIVPSPLMLATLSEDTYSKFRYWSSKPFQGVDYTPISLIEIADGWEGSLEYIAKERSSSKLHVISVRIYDPNKAIKYANRYNINDTQPFANIGIEDIEDKMLILPNENTIMPALNGGSTILPFTNLKDFSFTNGLMKIEEVIKKNVDEVGFLTMIVDTSEGKFRISVPIIIQENLDLLKCDDWILVVSSGYFSKPRRYNATLVPKDGKIPEGYYNKKSKKINKYRPAYVSRYSGM